MNASDKPKLAFVDILDQAKPAERTIRLCLRGDLTAQWEVLERDLAAAQARNADSLAGTGAPAIAAQMEALRGQMEQYTVTFRLRALTRRTYQALVAAHPPRRDADGKILAADAELETNADTFWFALTRACVVDPAMDDGQWARLVDEVLSDRQFETLAIAAYAACRGNVDIPFSTAASRILSSSGDGSSAPNDSGSLSGASTGGSLASPSTTTSTGG